MIEGYLRVNVCGSADFSLSEVDKGGLKSAPHSSSSQYNLPGSFEVPSDRRNDKIIRRFDQEITFLASGKVNFAPK
jgi:hypothetical protein